MTRRISRPDDLPFEDRVKVLDDSGFHDPDPPPEDDPWRRPPPHSPATATGEMVYQPTLDERIIDASGRTVDDDPDRLWGSRKVFEHIHQFARSRRVAPWAVLGSVLARVVAATPPTVQLPPTIGSHASLNLFVGLVGPSGSGKDAARSVARDAFDVTTHARARPFEVNPLGSGEGLSHMFMRRPKATKDDPFPEAIQYCTAALVTVQEIDTLGALASRQSSTVTSQLRQAAMGEQLGYFYVDPAKRMPVPEHSYRLCLVAGIQPRRADVLLNQQETDGGTPQRFLWLPVVDRDAPDIRPATPARVWWTPPDWGGGSLHELKVCDEATNVIEANHLKRTRGDGDALDGHALLTRLKVGAALAILDGRPEVESSDWELSGVIMEMSDLTREAVLRTLAQENTQRNTASAEAEAGRASIIRERREADLLRRVCGLIKRHLGNVADDGWMARSALRRKFASESREFVDAGLSALLDTGEVEAEQVEHHGQSGERFRLRRSPK